MSFVAPTHHLLLDHCTRREHDEVRSRDQRQLYIERLRSILEGSKLKVRTQDQVWGIGWDKPFFANMKASSAEQSVTRARQSGLFADYRAVAEDAFMVGDRLGQLLQSAIDGGDLTGPCQVQYRLRRVQAYARAVPRITDSVNAFYQDWINGNGGADQLQERAVAIAEDIGVGGGSIGKVDGFAFTTACHLLADLGLPVFKPDIWVCRIVSSLPGVRAEIQRAWRLAPNAPVPFNFLESKLAGARASDAYRRIVQPVMNALVREVQEHGVAATEFDLAPAFLRTRFVDWTVVHFAISAETEVCGLERRPVDVLRAAGEPPLPVHLKALAEWLDAGQASHKAALALKNAEAKVHHAKSPEERERARRRLDQLRQREAQDRRDALTAKAQAAWTAHETAAAAARWMVDARYPEGFARREQRGAWAYKRSALARRALRLAE
jgi:hypothetical protein